MEKFLLLWQLERSKIAVDHKERGAAWGGLITMVKNELENGIMSDWGSFPGEGRGYAVVSGSKLEVMRMVEQYSPFVKFRVHPVASILDTDELIKSLTG